MTTARTANPGSPAAPLRPGTPSPHRSVAAQITQHRRNYARAVLVRWPEPSKDNPPPRSTVSSVRPSHRLGYASPRRRCTSSRPTSPQGAPST